MWVLAACKKPLRRSSEEGEPEAALKEAGFAAPAFQAGSTLHTRSEIKPAALLQRRIKLLPPSLIPATGRPPVLIQTLICGDSPSISSRPALSLRRKGTATCTGA